MSHHACHSRDLTPSDAHPTLIRHTPGAPLTRWIACTVPCTLINHLAPPLYHALWRYRIPHLDICAVHQGGEVQRLDLENVIGIALTVQKTSERESGQPLRGEEEKG